MLQLHNQLFYIIHSPNFTLFTILFTLSTQWRAEAVGYPGPTRFLDALETILYSSRKISDDLFFSRSPKFFTFFASVVKFHENSLLGCSPSAASCPGNNIFYFFFGHLPTCFKENWPLGCPPGWMPGAVAPSAPRSARN